MTGLLERSLSLDRPGHADRRASGRGAAGIGDLDRSLKMAGINLPIAVLIWAMIVPMMLPVDFAAIGGIRQQPRGLLITVVVNWLIKP